jgi:hypothetical protein
MRPQSGTGQQVAITLTIVGHADGDIDPGPVERTRQRTRDIAIEGDFLIVAIEEDSDPAFAVSVEPDHRHFGRLGTIAIGLNV